MAMPDKVNNYSDAIHYIKCILLLTWHIGPKNTLFLYKLCEIIPLTSLIFYTCDL